MNTQLEAIVLKSFDYQDHHKIVKLISPSHGLISVFVGYANKKKSRYRAISEPLTCVSINVRKSNREQGGLYYLVHGDMINSYHELKVDYDFLMMFYEMVEVIIKGDIDKFHLPYAYRTLKEVLDIGAKNEMKFRFGVVIFKAKLIIAIGLAPAVDGCINCNSEKKIVTASVSEGGLICETCYAGDGIWLKVELIPLWRAIFKRPVASLLMLEVGEEEVEALEIWLVSYFEGYSNIRFAKRLLL